MAIAYPIIKQDILDKIKNGFYQPLQTLPPERELTEIYGVSRMTIRRALDELIYEGILIRKKGSSVYVAPQKIKRKISHISLRNDQEVFRQYGNVEIRVLGLKVIKNHILPRDLLQTNEKEEIWELERVQYSDKKPLVYERIFFPKKYFHDLTKVDCSLSMTDIVSNTQKEDNIQPDVRITVETILASGIISKLLEVSAGSPVMKLNIVVCNQGKPIYCGVNYYDGNAFMFEL